MSHIFKDSSNEDFCNYLKMVAQDHKDSGHDCDAEDLLECVRRIEEKENA